MENLVELTAEEKTNTCGGDFWGPIILDIVGFFNSATSGFHAGMSDSIKK
ncbi:MAG TPA: hypothetical protein VMI12_11425 [Puia sp.]|nr:hypothetical protein [Puia sp.]